MQLSVCFTYPLLYSLFRKRLNKTRLFLVVVWCERDLDILTRGCESERESKETHTPTYYFYFLLIQLRLFLLGLFSCLLLLVLLFVVFVFGFSLFRCAWSMCVLCLLFLYIRACVLCGCVLSVQFVLLVKQYHELVIRLKIFLPCSRQRIAPTFTKNALNRCNFYGQFSFRSGIN